MEPMTALISFRKMASITIKRGHKSAKTKLRVRAVSQGPSMEEPEVILKAALNNMPSAERNLVERIRRRFAHLGGIELTSPARLPVRPPLNFAK